MDMSERPELSRELDGTTIRRYYYLKEELVAFCREQGLPVTGQKSELIELIACYLDTGKVMKTVTKKKAKITAETFDEDMIIETDFVCSEKHRAFFKEKIGKNFTFKVGFMNWLKNNSGKTYKDAIDAYYSILEVQKNGKTTIGKQFEYNNYIRDFFADNKGKTLAQAIQCWNYKKNLPGNHKYEKTDLSAVE